MRSPIYLDYAATTPVAPEVAECMARHLTMDGVFANPASRAHLLGWQAEEAVEAARGQVADLIGADPREVVFTSGATESNNLALKGLASGQRALNKLGEDTPGGSKGHIITSAIEHKAVLDVCGWLTGCGYEVTYLQPSTEGEVSAKAVIQAIKGNTFLVSLMMVNNELGSVNPIKEVGAFCRANGIALHVDAAQAVGKLPVDVQALNVDALSLSAHKMYGPKGIGALYVRRSDKIRVDAQIHGGGHERGMRSGTLPTHQIVGLGQAAVLAGQQMAHDLDHLTFLRDQFWLGLSPLKGVSVNGSLEHGFPGILNVCFGACDGEQLLFSLQGLAVSTGSACTSASVEPSYVLKALGVPDALAHGSLRFSFGRYTTHEDVERAVILVKQAINSIN